MFHSEADFQHSLAWAVRAQRPDLGVRLERPTPWKGPRGSIDIWLRGADGAAAIELKYWTRRAELVVDGERYELKNQNARDTDRYDFWKDVARTERLVRKGHTIGGYVVALTYWDGDGRRWNDEAFRLYEGREVRGTGATPTTPAAAIGPAIAGSSSSAISTTCLSWTPRRIAGSPMTALPTGSRAPSSCVITSRSMSR